MRAPLSLLSVAVLCLAFQDSLANLKLTRPGFESAVSTYISLELPDPGTRTGTPSVPAAARQSLMAMGEPARAAVVKELGLAAKAFVMTPAFTAAYEAKLKAEHNAVNHGIAVEDTMASLEAAGKTGNMEGVEAKMQAMIRDQMKQMVLQMSPQVDQYDGATVKEMSDSFKDQFDNIPPLTAREKAQRAQALKLLAEAKGMSASNVAGARAKLKEGMMLGVYVEAGGGASAQTDLTKKEQQLNYNRRALKPTLKRKLLGFVAEAKTVDFKAITVAKGQNKVFSNPAYEQKSSMWKLMYRLGPAGSAAAVAVAQAWAAEL